MVPQHDEPAVARVAEAAKQTEYDDEVCFRAVRKIRDLSLRESDAPFFLTVSFTHPHDPWEIRQRYWDLYDEREIDRPPCGPLPRARGWTRTASACAT